MNSKGCVILALLLTTAPGFGTASAQATGDPAVAGQTSQAPEAPRPASTTTSTATSPITSAVPRSTTAHPAAHPAATPPAPGSAAAECDNGPCDAQPAKIAVAAAPPASAAWPLQDRIAWLASILLVVLGGVGISVALSALKRIEQQTYFAEAAAQSAADAAKAALEHAQAMTRAERPWVLVTIEPSRKTENRFMIMATNRGRGPARIVSAVDKITTEVEEARLPEEPQLADAKANTALASVILLPGESTGVKSFGRDDVKVFCTTDEELKRVENWEEMILLYGKIAYRDLISGGAETPYETSWCCWYIHGRQNSGMVSAGPAAYHRHT